MKLSGFSFLVTLLFLSGCGLFSNPDKRIYSLIPNSPTELEQHYYYLASAIASEKPCYLISHNSYRAAPGVAPINTSGRAVSLHRSRCFHNVARLSLRPEICENVKSVSTLIYSGSNLNETNCRQDVAAERRISGEMRSPYKAVEKVDLSDAELNSAMLSLRIFPNLNVLEAYKAEREDQFYRCANRRVIYSEMFFNKIDDLQNFAGEEDLEEMKNVEWQEHPFVRMPGFTTNCFLGEGATHWVDRGVGANSRSAPTSGFQIPVQQ